MIFHILLMAKKKKRFQIPFASPARPATTHSLTLRLPVTTQPWVV